MRGTCVLVVLPKLLLDELVQGRVEVNLRVSNSLNRSILFGVLLLFFVKINKVGAARNLRQRDVHLRGIVCRLGFFLERIIGAWLHFLRACSWLGLKLLIILTVIGYIGQEIRQFFMVSIIISKAITELLSSRAIRDWLLRKQILNLSLRRI